MYTHRSTLRTPPVYPLLAAIYFVLRLAADNGCPFTCWRSGWCSADEATRLSKP
jgi:hypothetical protein